MKITHITYIINEITWLITNQFGHSHWENDMVHNYTHGPSMFNHFGPSTMTLQKVEPSTHQE
jgi:hypothetical protein